MGTFVQSATRKITCTPLVKDSQSASNVMGKFRSLGGFFCVSQETISLCLVACNSVNTRNFFSLFHCE